MAKKDESAPQVIEGQQCPICNKNTLRLMEDKREIPFFGNCYLFSMTCANCKYHKADIEAEETHDPVKYTLEITSEKDMEIRVVRSAHGTIKIPHMITLEAGENANGFITNVEGILTRMKKIIEFARDNEEDKALQKKAKNQLKKLQKVMWGQETMKLIIEDSTGNSAIISEKATKTKL